LRKSAILLGLRRAKTMSRFRLFDLNDPQRQAVTTTSGPLLILAGAGTGKTRVITFRIAYLVAQGVDPAKIMAVTFTNKAANEMRERAAKMIEESAAKKITISTFHALCVRILRTDIERLGYKKNFTIYDDGDQLGLIKKIITRVSAKDEKLEPNVARSLISKMKNAGLSAAEDDKTLMAAVFARYQQDLKTLNAVDFDDLLLLTVKLLNEHADIRERWQSKYEYLMVDEFQDTNRLQLEMVTQLANARKNVAVVGDDDQSIYGWRGAEVSNILEFETHFPNPTVVKLEQNYRSTSCILNAANSLIKNNPRRRGKKLWSDGDSGDKVKIVIAPDDREEAQYVTNEIHQRHTMHSVPFENFAVLYRMNAQSRLIEENLRRMQIPYRLIGGKSFFDRREIKDLLCYANSLVNPDDDVSLLRIINTPARGISDSTVERAMEHSIHKHVSLFKALQDPEFTSQLSVRASTAIANFVTLLDSYETKLAEPLADASKVMYALLEEVKYFDDLGRSCKTQEEALNRETGVRQMLEDLSRYQERFDKGLRGFLDEVMLDQEREKDKEEDKNKGVTLITLHAAKGLEYPHVFLLGLEEGLLPHDRSKLEGTVDEERRLLYVGITRAMKTLTMSHCHNRLKFGSTAPCTPSSFIKEIDPQYIENVDLRKLFNTPATEEAATANFAAMRAMLSKL